MAKKKAFTLAEVLITLAIIGIVSAMTIPTLINNYQKKITVERLKTTFSLFSQAMKMAEAEHSYTDTIANPADVENFVEVYLAPYMKITDKKTSAPIHKGLNGNNSDIYGVDSIYYQLANGVEFRLEYNGYWKVYFVDIDINGPQGPNILGLDTFRGQIGMSKYGFYLNGCAVSDEDLVNPTISSSCTKETSGTWCGALIIRGRVYFTTCFSASITTGSHFLSFCIISIASDTGKAFLYGLSEVIALKASATAIILEPKGIDIPFSPSGFPLPSYRSV